MPTTTTPHLLFVFLFVFVHFHALLLPAQTTTIILPVICSDCCKNITDTVCSGFFTFCDEFQACRGGCRCPELTSPITVGQDGGAGCAPTDKDDCVFDEPLCLQGIAMRKGDPVTVASQTRFCVVQEEGGVSSGVFSPSAAPTNAPTTPSPTPLGTANPTLQPRSAGNSVDLDAVYAGVGTVAGCAVVALGWYFVYMKRQGSSRKGSVNPKYSRGGKSGVKKETMRRSLLRTMKPPRAVTMRFSVGSSVFEDADESELMEALFDFAKEEEDEIEVKKGEVVRAVQKVNDEWVFVQNENGEQGIVPYSYLSAQLTRNRNGNRERGGLDEERTVLSTRIGYEVDDGESKITTLTEDELF